MGPSVAPASPSLRGVRSGRATVLLGWSKARLVDVPPILSHRAG